MKEARQIGDPPPEVRQIFWSSLRRDFAPLTFLLRLIDKRRHERGR